MILDFRRGDVDKNIEADICVIGAGAAGITIAHAFLNTDVKVCLLESGGFELEGAIQALYQGEEEGMRSADLTSARMRYFGGTTALWKGYCVPLNEMDFEPRTWVPYSGWPIRRQDLDPYYAAAHPICEIGPYRYDLEDFPRENHTFPSFSDAKLMTRLWQVSPPTHFGERYRSELEKVDNVRVYLYANVTNLEVDESASTVKGARISTLDGVTGIVRARYYVLACGGIENARILLLSDQVQREGLGNSSDLVGRFFMQHPWVASGVFLASDPELIPHIFSHFNKKELNTRLFPGICLTPEAQKREQVLNYVGAVFRVLDGESGYDNLRRILRGFKQGRWPDEFSHKLSTVITDLDEVAKGVYLRATGRGYKAPIIGSTLTSQVEQAPNPDSRVTLTEEKDQLGLRKVGVDWRLTELEKRTVRTAVQFIGEEFGRLELGRIKLADWLEVDDDRWPEPVWGGGHHMGTTRMADDPKQGVVDRDCRVHSVSNLYMASSSVFPTCGYANPTLTIVALAIRLSEHLKRQFV